MADNVTQITPEQQVGSDHTLFSLELAAEPQAHIPDPDMEKAELAADASGQKALKHDVDKATEALPPEEKSAAMEFLQQLPSNALNGIVRGVRALPGEAISVGPSAVRGAVEGVESGYNALSQMEALLEPYFSGKVLGIEINPMGAGRMVRQFVAENLGIDKPEGGEGEVDLPKPEKSDKATGQAVEAISQFLVGFIPAFKAAKGAMVLKGIGGVGADIVASMPASAFAGFFTMAEDQDNATRMLLDAFPNIKSPVLEWLATDSEDPALANRAKRAIEESMIGPVGEAVFSGVTALRAAWKARGQKGLPALAEAGLPKVDTSGLEIKFGGSLAPDAPAVSLVSKSDMKADEFAAKYPSAVTNPGEYSLNINLRKLNTRTDILNAIENVTDLLGPELQGIRGDKSMTAEQITKLADTAGVPMSQLEKRWGEDDVSRIMAARTLLVASADNLLRLANLAKTSRDPADLVAYRKAFAVHAGIQAEVVGRAASAGRNLRAFQVPIEGDEELARNLTRMLEQSGGADMASSMAELTSQLSPEQLMRAGGLPDTRSLPGKAFDVFLEWWINALLSAPTTHIVNTLSNSATALWSIPENALAQGVENGMAAGGISAAARMYGLITGMRDGGKIVAHVLRTGEMPIDAAMKIDINRVPETITASGDNLAAGAIRLLGQTIRIPGKALMTEDIFFKAIGYSMKRAEAAALRAYQNGARGKEWASEFQATIADAPQDIRMAAVNEAEYLTFTNPTGQVARGLLLARNAAPPLKLFFPFVNTPANILKYTFERTPLAPLSAHYRNAIKAGGVEASKARAKMFLGTMQMMTFADYASQGLITGSGPTDPDLRRVWLLDHQPYSIRVGDNWVQYSRLDPMGFLIGFSADFSQIAGYLDEGEAGEVISAAVLSTTSNFTDKTYLAGLSMLNEFLASSHTTPELDTQTLKRTLQQFGSTALVPRGVASVRQGLDPYKRATDGFMDTLKNQIPGYSDTLPADHNIWGEPIIPSPGMGEGNMGALYRTVVPFKAKPVTKDPINQILLDNKIGLSYPNRTIDGVRLTETEYQFLKVARGQRARKGVESLVTTVDFKNAPRHIKESMVRRVFLKAGEVARAEMYAAFPDLITRLQYKKKFDLETEPTDLELQ